MTYQVGQVGRVVVAQLENGDEILGSLAGIVQGENIRAGVVYLVGGSKEGADSCGAVTR